MLIKALYGARTCRWLLLHSINALAREVAKCNKTRDVRLHKRMCYIRAILKRLSAEIRPNCSSLWFAAMQILQVTPVLASLLVDATLP